MDKIHRRWIFQSSCQQILRVLSLASSQRFQLQSKCSWNDMPLHLAICWQFKCWELYCCQSFKLWQLFKCCQQKMIVTNLSVRAQIADSSLKTLTAWSVSVSVCISATERFISARICHLQVKSSSRVLVVCVRLREMTRQKCERRGNRPPSSFSSCQGLKNEYEVGTRIYAEKFNWFMKARQCHHGIHWTQTPPLVLH